MIIRKSCNLTEQEHFGLFLSDVGFLKEKRELCLSFLGYFQQKVMTDFHEN